MSGRLMIMSKEDLLLLLIDHDGLRAACEGDPKWNQFIDEESHQAEEYYRLAEEIEKLKKTNAESKQVELLEQRKQVAYSKGVVAWHQHGKRQSELEKFLLEDDLKTATSPQERRRIQQRLEVVDRNILSSKSEVHHYEWKANRYEEELKQLGSTIIEKAMRVSAGREQLSHDSQSAQHPSSSASHLPHIPEYLSVSSGAAEDISDNSKPTSTNLTVIRWRNDRGEEKKFRLKQSIMHRWRDIGDLVVPRQRLAGWAKRMDDEEGCRAVLSHWLDHPPRHYPATWEGLYELLDDSELGQVATELKQAVDNAI